MKVDIRQLLEKLKNLSNEQLKEINKLVDEEEKKTT